MRKNVLLYLFFYSHYDGCLFKSFEKNSKGPFHGCVALPHNIACHLYTQKRLRFQIKDSL